MKKKILKILVLIIVLSVLVYACFLVKYNIYSLANPEKAETVGSFEFTKLASRDGVILRDGRLFDIYSLAGDAGEIEKACPT